MHERRQKPRVTVKGELVGRIKSSLPARVVNLSERGALLETDVGLPPASRCEVLLPTSRGSLRLDGEVRRCRASTRRDSPGHMIYHAAIEFLDVDRFALETLRHTLVDIELGVLRDADAGDALDTIDGIDAMDEIRHLEAAAGSL